MTPQNPTSDSGGQDKEEKKKAEEEASVPIVVDTKPVGTKQASVAGRLNTLVTSE